MIKIPNPLSGYLGSREEGGFHCQTLEREWAKKFDCNHAIAVNSATSGLLAACMACGVGPDDEVIVPAFTMSATAAAPAVLGAKIVFADTDETFTLDPVEVANSISNKTAAVIVTNLFGHPGHLRELHEVCSDSGVVLIEDNSQAIYAMEDNRFAGTIGDMGVFSLNVHKHIQTGEGGIVVSNNQSLATKLRGAMNHGEMRGLAPGLNLRMTEITAMLACEQLKLLGSAVLDARNYARRIHNIVKDNPDIVTYPVRDGCMHSYYCYPMACHHGLYEELVDIGAKPYVRPLYELQAFKKYKTAPCFNTEAASDDLLVIELCHNPNIENIIAKLETLCARN